MNAWMTTSMSVNKYVITLMDHTAVSALMATSSIVMAFHAQVCLITLYTHSRLIQALHNI